MHASAGQQKVAKSLTLHIGTEKTGTTTLQHLLFLNRGVLKDAGLLYPLTPGHKAHTALKHLALDSFGTDADAGEESSGLPRDAAALMAQLREEIAASGCSHVLCSHEHFSSRLKDAESIRRLVDAMRTLADDVRMLVFIRPQYELFPSSFSTRVKGGSTEPALVPDRVNRSYLNYDMMLGFWEEVLGAGNITVRRFGRAYFKDGDLIRTFFDALGFAMPPGLVTTGSRNASLDGATVEFLRHANLHLKDMLDGEGQDFRVRLVEALQRISTRNTPVLPPKIMKQVDETFAPSNQKVAERYFPGETGPLFLPFDPSAVKPYRELTPSVAVEICLHLLRDPRRMEKLEKKLTPRSERAVDPERREERRARKFARAAKRMADAAGAGGDGGKA